MRNAFHQATVADECVGIVIDDVKAGFVELGGEQLFRQRHADRIAQALAERTGGGFDTRRHVHFRMSRGLGMHLTKIANFIHR